MAKKMAQDLPPLAVRRLGDGPPVILLHGIQGSSQSWTRVAQRLVGLRCVLPDLPGRGGARRAQGTAAASIYHLDHFADLVHALIEEEAQRCGGRVCVAGWSMGVSVLLHAWARHGGAAIDRMALLSGTPLARDAAWFRSESTEDIVKEAQERARRLGLKAPAEPQAVALSLRSARQLDQRGVLPFIDRPVLVLHGDADEQSPPAHGRWIAQGIARAQWVELAGVGHGVLADAEVEVSSRLRRFFLG